MIVILVVVQEVIGILIRINVDFTKSIVQAWILVTLGCPCFQPWLQQFQSISLLHMLHERLDWAHAANRHDQILNIVLTSVTVQQGPHHCWGLHWAALLNKHIHVLQVLSVMQVAHHLLNVVVLVAHVDQRPQILQLRFLQEILGPLRLINRALTSDPLHLRVLTHTRSCLDVPEMHFGILAEVDDGPQVVVECFIGLEAQEHLDELLCPKLIRVFCSHLDTDLEIATCIVGQQLLQAIQAVFLRQLSKEIDQPLRVDCMGIDDDTSDVGNSTLLSVITGHFDVVLQSPLVQLRLLT
mmetsp:Transcript_2592/g.4818  ORF Transcript_2592/g.4818 Transcript_2592/m.4818 type:complete len:297 (+) Transcript_2592:888-1778(+)